MLETVAARFAATFGGAPAVSASAPGRTNLIGEHTDYQGGYVLPFAVDRSIVVCGRTRADGDFALHSLHFNQTVAVPGDGLAFRKDALWANYILGVVAEFRALGVAVPGLEIAAGGDVPIGSGLSSSAALEVAAAAFLMKLLDVRLDPVEVARLARRAENSFVGVNCGIMDQFSSALCRTDHALLLNCKTLEYRHIPLVLPGCRIILVDTRKERKLAGSAYNRRVVEVAEALAAVRTRRPAAEFLGDVDSAALEEAKDDMDPTVHRRARHIVEENARVLAAAAALESGDLETLGRLIFASHESLRALYEVSCDELDFIVEFAAGTPGVVGARLTGAGFGGCAIAVVRETAAEGFRDTLERRYRERFGKRPAFYEVRPADGALV